MHFRIELYSENTPAVIPVNYQYPLSAAIYRILQKGDAEYSQFLHETGYGKGYKFFTFSDLKGRFKIIRDRMHLRAPNLQFSAHFHLPEASRTFVEGLFRSEEILIADKKSKTVFQVRSILSARSPWEPSADEQSIAEITVKPASMLVTGFKNERGHYDFLSPDDTGFTESLIFSWRNKIGAAFDVETAEQAVLFAEMEKYPNPWRSRLVTIKADTAQQTKIRGFLNFKLKLKAEKRFLDLVLNAGLGLYSTQGMGCLEVVGGGKYDSSKT